MPPAHSPVRTRTMTIAESRDGTRSEPTRRPLGRAVQRILVVVALARAMQFIEAVLFPLVAVERGAGAGGQSAGGARRCRFSLITRRSCSSLGSRRDLMARQCRA
jgi:hypothetical protein